ncbi:MAG: ATP-dependent DNA helicase RecG [Deltaproteobacteria bacterium]|nr:MAG: ATP-dependent DNA helicase RecG [Deltaproteobacteria bacterium]
MTELHRRVEALRAPLQVAARDQFAGLANVRDLGATLRAAVDRLVPVAPEERRGPLLTWRRRLDGFERLDRAEQSVEVARGLRLCQVLAGPAPARRGAAANAGRAPSRRAAATARAGEDDGAGRRTGARAAAGAIAAAPVAPAAVGPLDRPVTDLPGIGPKLAAALAERSIETVEDLVWLVPRRYDDVRRAIPLEEAVARVGERVTTAGDVAAARFLRRGPRRWVEVRLADGRARLVVRWFHAHAGMVKRFPRGARVAVSGVVRARAGAIEMANPDVLGAGPGILPRYGALPGVPPATLRKACWAAVERARDHIVDGVPADVAARAGLAPLADALLSLHAPPEDLPVDAVDALNAGTSPWHRRLAFDDLFFLGLAVARRRRRQRSFEAVPCPIPPARDAALSRALPFALTAAQRRAIDAIGADLARSVPMNRLLQGDVGSGKTAVAFAAAHQVIAAGRQVALMAPTELLAEQHAAALAPWCDALGIRLALLTASTPRGVRASTLGLLEAGRVDLAVGTHALIADGVRFAGLGLAIVDEQHRFGVAQRLRLRGKGDASAPHLLVMTATPIPRTLALTAYGDLDVTTIDELPPGRTPPQTRVLSGKAGRRAALAELRRCIAAGGRAYVVCPLVEPSDAADRAAATAVAAELAGALAPARVGLVHGRMAQPERDAAMAAFRAGDIDVLVATTVIEVGVDVPEATLMVVEDADAFGLAQLHQLRGRVGRGGGASQCLLVTRGGHTSDGAQRLAVMAQTTDGFRIAEADLRMRGPGELFGARQAGLPKLRFGDLQRHAELLALARDEAERLIARDPDLARHPVTRAVLDARTAGAPIYGAESG